MSLVDVHHKKEEEEARMSLTSGSIPMNISGRMIWERERCIGMTDTERAWRKQWLEDQVLHGEPIIPKGFYEERYNPIRRFYRAPLDIVENKITQKWNLQAGKTVRHLIANVAMVMTGIWTLYYWAKYNPGDWTRRPGPRIMVSRMKQYPGDPGFPTVYHPKPQEYATYGFEKSKI